MCNASTTSAVKTAVTTASSPITATAVVKPSIFDDISSVLGPVANVADTIAGVLSHLGLAGTILAPIAAPVEAAAGVIDAANSVVSGLGSEPTGEAVANAALAAAQAAGITGASDVTPGGSSTSGEDLLARIQSLEAAVSTLVKHIGVQ